ncbi:hypothetical protein [Mesorhizobium sp. M1182]
MKKLLLASVILAAFPAGILQAGVGAALTDTGSSASNHAGVS